MILRRQNRLVAIVFFGCIVGHLNDISASVRNAYLVLHGQLVTLRNLVLLYGDCLLKTDPVMRNVLPLVVGCGLWDCVVVRPLIS